MSFNINEVLNYPRFLKNLTENLKFFIHEYGAYGEVF